MEYWLESCWREIVCLPIADSWKERKVSTLRISRLLGSALFAVLMLATTTSHAVPVLSNLPSAYNGTNLVTSTIWNASDVKSSVDQLLTSIRLVAFGTTNTPT